MVGGPYPFATTKMLSSPARAIAPRIRARAPPPVNLPKTRTNHALAPFSSGYLARASPSMAASSSVEEEEREEEVARGQGGIGALKGGMVSLSEWQAWGTDSPLPAMVMEAIKEMKDLEEDFGAKMKFGGVGSKIKGTLRVIDDKKKRSVYKTLDDPEQKLQYFTARQVACRLLGSKGYLCQKCWLPKEDCMCSRMAPCDLWRGIRFWLYMHPKDFLRQNNTGKLLWQLFGVRAATMCVYGIPEQEEIMWDAFKSGGKDKLWILYPNENSSPKSLQDIELDRPFAQENKEKPLNFILLDGTWSNSSAMYKRLKERWSAIWGEEDLPCISLSSLGASVMHKLRPQPAWDRTCTAAASAGLLSELGLREELGGLGFDKQANTIENSLDILLDALTKRRLHMGRSITRKQRHNNCI
ncbi:DTW domain-containing protein YfiP [Carex littledalei]|uniref:tRNA-uridine aminocarboxypropyltransferase n=1 Tax=Carex littledalei TaxID=544730 RepID=A0A833VSE9_9POAL|nr:DTW domain-containing protein YfiP [Carex littledalei]